MSNRLDRKAEKAAKKQAKREYRQQHPGRLRRNINEAANGLHSVKEVYSEMNSYMKGEYVPEPQPDNDVPEENTASIRHTKGKFTIEAHPTVKNIFVFLMSYELRTTAGVFAIVVDVAAFILLLASIFAGSAASTVLLLTIMLLILIIVGPGSTFLRAVKATKLLNSENGKRMYCFSSAGFDTSGKSGYYGFTWDMLLRVKEISDCFMFYLAEDDGFVVSKADISASGRKPDQFADMLVKYAREKFVRPKNKKNKKS